MKKLLAFALVMLLAAPCFGAVGMSDKNETDGEDYVGEVTSILVDGQELTFDGGKVTMLANGHKSGVTTNVSTESNLTSAALAYGYISLACGKTKYVNLADGTPGQMITIQLPTLVGDYATVVITDDKVSYANRGKKTGWDDITFDTSFDSITLLYMDDTNGWVIVGNNGCTIT